MIKEIVQMVQQVRTFKIGKDHLGHPRVTVARQSDWALFALGLNLAKSTSSPYEERWPITALEFPEVNKPQARISGVGDFHSSPIHSHTCIEVTSATLALDDLGSCQI
jgi:hypothetical protein